MHRTTSAFVLFLGLCLPSCGGSSGPEPEVALAEVDLGVSGTSSGVFDQMLVTLQREGDALTLVGDGRPLSVADEGTSVDFLPGNDPQFPALAAVLTNDAADTVLHSTFLIGGGGGGSSGPEAGVFMALQPNVLDPDFAGFTITRIELQVVQLDIAHPTGNTSFTFSGKLILHGFEN